MFFTQPLHRNAQQQADHVATICGDRSYTHAQLVERVARLAGGLGRRGVSADDRVAVLALNSDKYLQVAYALAWADAVIVPLNFRWSAKEIAFALGETGTRMLMVDNAFLELATAAVELTPSVETVLYCGDGGAPPGMESIDAVVAESAPVSDAMRPAQAPAGVFYTGGTTGVAKGVMLSARNLFASALGAVAAGAAVRGGRVLHAAPMFHLADYASTVMYTMLGGSHVFIPTFEPTAVLHAISEHGVTDALLVPTMLQMIADHPSLDGFDLSTLRHVTYGASPMSAPQLERARRTFPAAEFVQAYGMTELSPVATILNNEFHADPVRGRSAGRAAPHALVKVVDDQGNETTRGSVGQIVVSGEHVMLGYWGQPELTASAIRDGWMQTGDGGYMDDDGFVYLVDRIKDMIISGGENVYSVEVENAVATHPAVAQCAVIGLPDDQWGERVHAVVSLVPGAHLDLDQLRAHCRAHIAGYKLPRGLEIVDEFPMSGAGKILKRELRDRHAGMTSGAN